MCLAIAVRKGAVGEIPREHLEHGFRSNKDGAGFAWHTGGKVQIDRGYMTFDAFWAAFSKRASEFPSAPFLIHFRTATNGKVCTDNCHPFKFKGGAMIHNGGFNGIGDGWNKERSDTRHLAEIMHDLPVRAIPFWIEEMESEAGGYNKVAILDNTGEIHIMNEKSGYWVGNVWYSNSGYKPYASQSQFFGRAHPNYGVHDFID